MNKSSKYFLISFVTFVTGFLFLKFAYLETQNLPFVQEIVLIILGTIATISITAALLNKQSEIELEKEQRAKIFDLKADLYFELIDLLEEIILVRKINNDDLVKLEFLTHKISVIASSEVLTEYYNLLQAIKESTADGMINADESDIWSVNLANLCSKIRCDLVPEKEDTIKKDHLSIRKNANIFLHNNKKNHDKP